MSKYIDFNLSSLRIARKTICVKSGKQPERFDLSMNDKTILRNGLKLLFLSRQIAVLGAAGLMILGLCADVRCYPGQEQSRDETERRLLKQAEKHSKRGEFPEAEQILRRVVEIAPRASTAKLKLAFVLVKQKKLREAYELSFEAARAEPKNSFAFAVLGAALLSAGRFREANLAFLNSLALNKKESLAWAGLGTLDFYENRISKSLANLNEAIAYRPDEPDYVLTFAQVASRAEKYRIAAAAYRRFLAISAINDRDRRERIRGLIELLDYLGGRQSLYELEGAEKTSVGFRLVNNRPLIELKINDRDEPLRFILDTGSGMTVVSEETARKLRIKPVARGGTSRAVGGSGKFEIVYGFLRAIKIGDVKIKNVPVYIRRFHNNDDEIDGYIGLSLISKFLTTVDYGDLTFSLAAGKAANDTPGDATAALPLRLTPSGFLSGEVRLEGLDAAFNFIVDTGATVSVISERIANTDEIGKFMLKEKMTVTGSGGVTEGVSMFLLPRVSFGVHARERITAIALDLDVINETTGFEQLGILGGNFLKNYRLTFDFQKAKVFFEAVRAR
jgi:predicted aspartyl protease/Tfp pilus assembly protein PilF